MPKTDGDSVSDNFLTPTTRIRLDIILDRLGSVTYCGILPKATTFHAPNGSG